MSWNWTKLLWLPLKEERAGEERDGGAQKLYLAASLPEGWKEDMFFCAMFVRFSL